MKLQEINRDTKEGMLLVMAISSLAVSPEIKLNGKTLDGRKMTPDEVLSELEELAWLVYGDNFLLKKTDNESV